MQGYCKNGDHCKWDHILSASSASFGRQQAGLASRQGLDTNAQVCPIQAGGAFAESSAAEQSDTGDPSEETHKIHGAKVTFGPGANVVNIEFPSDFSSVQIKNLSSYPPVPYIKNFLRTMKEEVPTSCIRVKPPDDDRKSVAIVRLKDPGFAKRLITTIAESTWTRDLGVEVTEIVDGNNLDASTNRLQMTSVTCNWYKPSITAWMHYKTLGKGREAAEWINEKKFEIAGRRIQAGIQNPQEIVPGRKPVFSVVIRNVEDLTTEDMISGKMPWNLKPVRVMLGKISYEETDEEPERAIKALLRGHGALEAWEVNKVENPTVTKATAHFATAEEARAVARLLDGTTSPKLGGSTLSVRHKISVKFNILINMYIALHPSLKDLKPALWDLFHVNLRQYPLADSSKKYITLRISGQDPKSVAKAKSLVQNVLAGSLVVDGETTLWDNFFESSAGFAFLKDIGAAHGTFVYCDKRNKRLLLHGSQAEKEQTGRRLAAKVNELSNSSRTILLTSEDFKLAMQGGFRRISRALGKEKTSIDIISQPKTITINGSQQDLSTAMHLLRNEDLSEAFSNLSLTQTTGQSTQADTQPDCSVCFCPATDPFRTHCKHIYCKSCFTSQCGSIAETTLPLSCLGDSGQCQQVFSLHTLKSTLPFQAFERLSHDSLRLHVHTHPQSLHYCPTPDCESIYRVSPSADAAIPFDCPSCLTPICTFCKGVGHEGLTCAEAKDLASEDDLALRRWKKLNRAKDCPRCGTGMQKAFGCNHLECKGCNAHICWVCMDTFEGSEECYRHLRAEHDGIGVPEVLGLDGGLDEVGEGMVRVGREVEEFLEGLRGGRGDRDPEGLVRGG